MKMTFSQRLVGATLFTSAVAAAKYDQYILAPSSRVVHPQRVHQVNGTVQDAESVLGEDVGRAIFQGPSAVTYDFGKVQRQHADEPAIAKLTTYRTSLVS